MSSTSASNLEVIPSGEQCGAVVKNIDLSKITDEHAIASIRQAWLEHKVLAFTDQHLSDEDLERFTLLLGTFGEDPYFESIPGYPNIAAIHRTAEETAPIFAEDWHTDWSFQEHPPAGTCLYGKVVPRDGGDTMFINQVAALEAMPEQLRRRIEGLNAIHSARLGYAPDGKYGSADSNSGRATKITPNESAYATQAHPLIQIHPETGEASLFGTIGYIIGIENTDDEEASEILMELYAWQTRSEFQYRQTWEPHMLVMWDNRSVLHKATGGYDGHERLMHRTTIAASP